MPCFDPANVLFITNKWNTLPNEKEDSDSSDEDEVTQTWRTLLCNIKQLWPAVKEEHIFKMNLIEVMQIIHIILRPCMFTMLRVNNVSLALECYQIIFSGERCGPWTSCYLYSVMTMVVRSFI